MTTPAPQPWNWQQQQGQPVIAGQGMPPGQGVNGAAELAAENARLREVLARSEQVTELLAMTGQEDPSTLTHEVLDGMMREGVRHLARRRLAELEAAQAWQPPTAREFPGTLADSLKRERRPERCLIEGLWGVSHNLSIEALFKTGKTTLVGSLLGSLADGTDFLGFAPVHKPGGPVAVWNCEMDEDEFDDLYLAPYIKDHARVIVAHLRGKPMPVMTSKPARDYLVGWLRSWKATVWIIDTWTRLCIWNGIDPADNAGVAKLTACLDEIKAEAGVSAMGVTSHMPHAARTDRAFERGFGAQAFSGWVDTMWRYAKDDTGQRFLSADGRKIHLDERQVLMTPEGVLYTQPGDRSAAGDASGEVVTSMVALHVQNHPGQAQAQIETALGGLGRNKVRKALGTLITGGLITLTPGPRNSHLHYWKAS